MLSLQLTYYNWHCTHSYSYLLHNGIKVLDSDGILTNHRLEHLTNFLHRVSKQFVQLVTYSSY